MTPVKKIFEELHAGDMQSFLEFMINNEKTLIREEKENIMDAVNYGLNCQEPSRVKADDYYSSFFE